MRSLVIALAMGTCSLWSEPTRRRKAYRLAASWLPELSASSLWKAISPMVRVTPCGVVAASRILAICTGEARTAARRAMAGSSTMRSSMTSSALVPWTTTSLLSTGLSLRRMMGRGSSAASRIVSSASRRRCRFTFS